MTLIKKIGNVALKTLGWTALPEIMIARNKFFKGGAQIPVFLLSYILTTGVTSGIHAGYTALTAKKYSTKNIQIKIKQNIASETEFKDLLAYASPLTKLVQVGLANDITSIKTYSLEIEVENSNLITFTKSQGFALNTEACYNSNFKIKEGMDWVKYNPIEVKNIVFDYEKIRKKNERIRERAINTGNIGEISELEDKMAQLQNDYEYKKGQLKKTQNRLEKEVTDIVNRLNTEYLNYIKAPKNTAIPVRDYNLSDIKRE
jgi:hypothetical protein